MLPDRFTLLLILILMLPASVSAADFAIIVNRDNPLESLEISEVKKIFLGKKNFWANGDSIDVLLQEEGETHQSFVQNVLDKSPRQFQMYWKRELFSGTGIPPRRHPDDQSVKASVVADPGAIGYIDTRWLDTSIKQLRLE